MICHGRGGACQSEQSNVRKQLRREGLASAHRRMMHAPVIREAVHPAAARLLASERLLRRAILARQCWLCVHALELVWKIVFEDGPQEVGAGVPLALED